MSPEPYVRGQALALAFALVAAATLGSALWTLGCVLATGLVALGLQHRYRGDLATAKVSVPRRRERLDLIVAGDLRAALGIGLAVSGALALLSVDPPDTGIAPASLVLLAITAATILLSSLVDWYVILPRISGLLGIRPCRAPDSDHPRFPKTWREVTKWWYIHRIVAALVLRFGLAYAIVVTVAQYTSVPYGASVVGGAAVGGFAVYLAAIPKAIWQAAHPSLIVGRTVRRRKVERKQRFLELPGARVAVPMLSRRIVGQQRPPSTSRSRASSWSRSPYARGTCPATSRGTSSTNEIRPRSKSRTSALRSPSPPSGRSTAAGTVARGSTGTASTTQPASHPSSAIRRGQPTIARARCPRSTWRLGLSSAPESF